MPKTDTRKSTGNQIGRAAGVSRTMNNIGMVLSFAIALTVASASIPRAASIAIFAGTSLHVSDTAALSFMNGLHSAFLVSSLIILITIFLSIARGKEDRAGEQRTDAKGRAYPGPS